jgi:uncharacterized delta-60 repeat protein
MTASVKVSGVYKDTAPWAKVAGSWKRSKEAWTKIGGAWKQFFLAGGVYDSSFNILDSSVSLGNMIDGSVTDIAIQADGKILATGNFYNFYDPSNGGTQNRGLGRINTDNTPDVAFSYNIGINFNQATNCVAVQSDQKILVGGQFTTFAGVTVNRIVRLNSDGTRDTTFTTNTGTAFNGAPDDIAIQTDGKIVVVGTFTTFNGTTVNRIARLNTNGTLDTTFTTNTGTAFSGGTSRVAIQSDGKILVSGTYATFNGVTVNNLVRLNTDGTRDTTFTTSLGTGFAGSPNGGTVGLAVQSDGKILVGGVFTSLNGIAINRFIRLNSDGTRDTSFVTNIGTALSSGTTVDAIAVQPDNKIILVGFFPLFNGSTVNGIIRLNSDGTTDTSFASQTGIGLNSTGRAVLVTPSSEIVVAGFFNKFNGITVSYFFKLNTNGARTFPPPKLGIDGAVTAIAVQSDEKIILAGNFTAFNETVVYDIVRLNKNGTLDTSFNAGLASGPDNNDIINSIALQSDGKVIVGGDFTSFNGVSGRNRLVRLNTDGTVDTTFLTNIGTAIPSGFPDEEEVRCVAVQADNKIIVGGKFATFNSIASKNFIRLNSDGTRDTAFMANLGTGFTHSVFSGSDRVSAINVQSDNSILVAGQFNSLNGTVVRNIVKLNQDGTRQTSFTTNIGTGADQEILAVTTKPDGKIVIAGQFNAFNGHTISKVAQLQSSGARDTSFNPGSGTLSLLYAVTAQADNKILIGGQFSSFSSSDVKGFARLLENGSLDGGFNNESPMGQPTRDIRSIVIQPDKKILIGGNFRSEAKLLKNGVARIGSDLTA